MSLKKRESASAANKTDAEKKTKRLSQKRRKSNRCEGEEDTWG